MIYITSDIHFCHNRSFIYEPRGFIRVEDMNQSIVHNWNRIINEEDDVYILGDLMLNNDEEGLRLINSLKGWLHIIRGNHDTPTRVNKYLNIPNVIEVVNAQYLDYQKYHFYLSHYPTITSNSDYDKPLQQRLLNLCGHSHATDKWADADKGYIYHCELDAHNCTPILLDNIIADFKKKFETKQFQDPSLEVFYFNKQYQDTNLHLHPNLMKFEN